MMYALSNLGRGVRSSSSNPFYQANISDIRREIFLKLKAPSGQKQQQPALLLVFQPAQLDLLEQQWASELVETESLRRLLVSGVPDGDVASLRTKLHDPRPTVRLLTAQAVGRHRLPLEDELVGLLDDPAPAVVGTAHDSLVRLARGTDFGPRPGAYRSTRLRAARQWRSWLALQRDASDEAPIRAASGPTMRGGLEMAGAMQAVLHTEIDPAAALCGELLHAPREQQPEVLQRLTLGHGLEHTEALALAIHRLEGPERAPVRRALAERLTRMTAETLRDKLADSDPEVRRAAALACAFRDDRRHVPDLIPLLEDSEPSVSRAAHVALRSLTGQDFGREPGAATAWQDWWQKQPDR